MFATKNNFIEGEDMFYTDKPISAVSEDLLERKSFSKILAQTLVSLNNTDTFTVGLFGKWGTGKTSIVNMTLNEITELQSEYENKTIVVKFEPWHFSDSTQLLTQFFLHLSNEFRSKKDKNLSKIGDALEKYSSAFELAKLIPTFGDVIATLGEKGATSLGRKLQASPDEQDILKQKEFVIELLSEQKNQVLVVIDDIDRLSNEQIRQVFQLVSSVAKFPNTTYLLVFDKEVVVKALSKVQEGDGKDYLEKVIQMPIQIPEIQESKLHATLFKRLDDVLKKYPDSLFYNEHWQKIFNPCVAPFINNLRDINRLCNTLQFKLTTISPEVDFGDIIAISAIEAGLPPVYEWIKNNKNVLTQNTSWSGYGNKTQKEWYQSYLNDFVQILKDEKKAQITISCLSYLFPCFGQKIGETYVTIDDDLFRKRCLICHQEKFDRYFYFDINLVGIKKSEIQKAVFTLNETELVVKLLEEDKNGNGIEFLKEMKSVLMDISSERAKILFYSVLSSSAYLDGHNTNLFSMSTASYAEHICLDILDRVQDIERKNCILTVINDSDVETIGTVGIVINMVELAYGRLATEGTERNYKKVITEEELQVVETAYVNKIKELIREHSIFEFDKWRMALYLFKNFDTEEANDYLSKELEENKNILHFLDESVVLWIGGEEEYEITDRYSEYVSKERILEAIQQEKESGKIFDLPEKILKKCIAFYLNLLEKKNYHGHISQTDVDTTIEQWKKQ